MLTPEMAVEVRRLLQTACSHLDDAQDHRLAAIVSHALDLLCDSYRLDRE